MRRFIIGIDACNIRQGGTLTHLINFLAESDPVKHKFDRIIIWSNSSTLALLPTKVWLTKENHFLMEGSFLQAFFFQKVLLHHEINKFSCNILLVPGGAFLSSFKPFVAISQNMLPFEKRELSRYRNQKLRIKFKILRFIQTITFRKASGIIFLTEYARKEIATYLKNLPSQSIIPHGVNLKYIAAPKLQLPKNEFNENTPFKLLYVSILSPYKHQWNVAEAVCRIHKQGIPVHLTLVGPAEQESLCMLKNVLNTNSNSSECIQYLGAVPHNEIFNIYRRADAFIFASTCENLPIILIEAMGAGLPILCSNFGPMPEVLGSNGGMYFNPENVDEIEEKIKELLEDRAKRESISAESFKRVKNYSWGDMTDDTHNLLKTIYQDYISK